LCEELNIEYISPAHDDVIVALSRERELIPAAVTCPSEETCRITRSKSANYGVLADVVRVRKLYRIGGNIDCYPVLVKPDKGQGSFGVKRVDGPDELAAATKGLIDPIICEYLPGDEFTVHCFSARDRGILSAKARSRHRIRNGVSVNSVSEDVHEVRALAESINSILKLSGAWFFQLKRARNGDLTLLEVAPRIAGAMATHK